jgi:hypothetical protein
MDFRPNNVKIIMAALILAMVLVIPVSAIWQGTDWVTEEQNAKDESQYRIVTDPVTGVTSFIGTLPEVPALGDGCGQLHVIVLSGRNAFSKEMTIQRVDSENTRRFVNGNRIPGDQFDQFGKVGDVFTLDLDPTGRFEEWYAPGVYALKLLDGNGGQPEYAIAEVVYGYTTNVVFIGHVITPPDTPSVRADPIDASIDAFFGCNDIDVKWIKIVKTGEHIVPARDFNHCENVKIIDQPYVPAVQGIPAVTHQITVVDSPAVPSWDETVTDHAAWDETVTDHRAWDETVTDHAAYDVYTIVSTSDDYHGAHDGHAKKVHGSSDHDFVYNGNKYQITGSKHDPAYTIVHHPAVTHVVHHPAVTHVVHHPAVTHVVHHPEVPAVTHQETVIDVPAVPTVPAIPERHHHEIQCHIDTIPSHTVNEYGIEFMLEIEGAHVRVDNPNEDPVDVNFQFDVNYFVDKNPRNGDATESQIEPRSETYYGSQTNVGNGKTLYHGFLHPDIDDAVEVLGWDGLMYKPFIDDAIVTSTVWTS